MAAAPALLAPLAAMSSLTVPQGPSPLRELPPHAVPAEELAEALGTDVEDGLTRHEAAVRLAATGPNLVAPPKRPSYARIALRQLADPLVALLLAAAAVSAAIGERFEGAVIAAIVVLNAVLGFVQEAGAERALLALSRIRELQASVIREGRSRRCPRRSSFRAISSSSARGTAFPPTAGSRAPSDWPSTSRC